MKKKMLALMLMLLAALSALTAAAEGSLPDVGEIISGFKVTQLYALDALGGTVVHMEHEKTGAQLIYLANEDVNRTFSIGFRTKYDNDKGVPHVFEHACLSGSEKYPDPSLFFAMMNQTYNTFMNAMTATDYTIYPESSLSEDQLYVYADYVLSGVLHPLVVSDERSMMREAYRYELTDRDAQITLSGTVYSEMLGALSMNQRHLYELYKLMYPGSYTSTNTGGDPDVIPTMTQADFAAWTEENANSTMIDQMKAVSAQDLPEELTVYTAETKDADGVRMITSTADIGDLAAVGMVLDTSAVPADKLSELSFYATLLGSMPTENYTVEQLQTRAALLTNSISIDVGALELEGGGYAPMLTAQFVCMKDDLSEAMALVEEILTKTSLEDTDQMLMNATQAAFMPGYIAQNQPTQLANILLPAMTTKAGKYNYFVSFLQTDFEESLLAMDEDGLEAAKADMEQVWQIALSGNNASAFCIGDEEAQTKAERAATAFIAALDHTEREAVDYMALDTGLHGNVAVEVPGSMQYNYLVLPTKETGFAYSGKTDVMTAMVSDKLMIPVMRFQYSAYDASAGMGKRNLIVSTYRDPNLATTYEVFGQLGGMIRALDLTQDDLDGYITGAFGTLAMPMTAISGGAAAVNDVLQGTDSFGETKEKMHVMKTFTPEDVQTYAAMFDKLAEQGVKLCIGSAAEIEKNAEMFDTIVTDWAE